jgi:hypothetical protein
VDNNLAKSLLIENAVGYQCGNVTIDTFASGVAGFFFSLFFKVARRKKSVNFESFEEADLEGALQLHFTVTSLVAALVGNNVEQLPLFLFFRQQIVLDIFVRQRKYTTVSVHVADFGQSGIQTV